VKILMLCDLFQDELEYQENLLLKYYRRHGHEVVVVASLFESAFDYYADRAPKGAPRRYPLDGATIIKLPYRINLLNRVRGFGRIDAILDEQLPDLIYVHGISLNLPECVDYVRRHPASRMILDYHGDFSNSGKNWLSLNVLHRGIRKRYLDRARPYLSRIFPVTPACREFLEKVYDVPRAEMELLPLGADLEFGAEVRRGGARDKVRGALGIGSGDLVIFTGGKLLPIRRSEYLIDAFRALGPTDAHLVVVGKADADHLAYQNLLVSRATGHPRIHFVGWLDKKAMYEHLAAADIGIFPGGQSVIWQQAIGMGLPLIVADRNELVRAHQDASYLNRHGNMIFLDPAQPPAAEIEGLLRLLIGDRARLATMAQGARKTAAELLDWNVLIGRTLRFNTDQAASEAIGGSPESDER
jgi:1,2-diacylglycerol 3-alpha-glucosyltransferase